MKQDRNGEIIQKVEVLNERKEKNKISLIIIAAVILLLVGIVSGFYILKGLNNGVKENSFMHKILSNSGLLMTQNNEPIDEFASDNNFQEEFDYASDSNIINNLIFIQEKNGCSYYYYLNENGDYLYYYSYSDDIYNYYASDSNGKYISETYRDPIYFDVPDFTKMTLDEVLESYWIESINILWIPNDSYEENEIYYQTIEAGTKVSGQNYGTIIVNATRE